MHWYENDNYWEAIYPYFFSEKAFAQAAADLPKLMMLSGQDSGRLLDLGCGPGRHAVPFARQGFNVTGVDRTAYLLRKAKEYADAQSVQAEWVLEDMRNFIRPNTFDLAISMFTSFGYFEDLEDNRTVLRNLHESLMTRGVLLMDLMGKEILARRMQPAGVSQLPNGDMFIERREIVDDWQKAQTEIILIRGGEILTFPIRLWIFSAAEIKWLLTDAGFSRVTFFGNIDGIPYGPDATRLLVVAHK